MNGAEVSQFQHGLPWSIIPVIFHFLSRWHPFGRFAWPTSWRHPCSLPIVLRTGGTTSAIISFKAAFQFFRYSFVLGQIGLHSTATWAKFGFVASRRGPDLVNGGLNLSPCFGQFLHDFQCSVIRQKVSLPGATLFASRKNFFHITQKVSVSCPWLS